MCMHICMQTKYIQIHFYACVFVCVRVFVCPWSASQRKRKIFMSSQVQSRAEFMIPEFLGWISAWELDPQPWRFTDISLGLPHAHSFLICLFPWVYVVCVVCFLLYVSVYLCFARCVFSGLFHIHYHFFCFFVCVFPNSIYTYVMVPIDILIDLPMWLSFCSTVSSFLWV